MVIIFDWIGVEKHKFPEPRPLTNVVRDLRQNWWPSLMFGIVVFIVVFLMECFKRESVKKFCPHCKDIVDAASADEKITCKNCHIMLENVDTSLTELLKKNIDHN